MIVTHLKLPLEEAEYSALLQLANQQLRSPLDQARFILRQEFEKNRLLESERVTHLLPETKKRSSNGQS